VLNDSAVRLAAVQFLSLIVGQFPKSSSSLIKSMILISVLCVSSTSLCGGFFQGQLDALYSGSANSFVFCWLSSVLDLGGYV